MGRLESTEMLQARLLNLYKSIDKNEHMDTEQRGAEGSLVTEQLGKLTDTKSSSYKMSRSESVGILHVEDGMFRVRDMFRERVNHESQTDLQLPKNIGETVVWNWLAQTS